MPIVDIKGVGRASFPDNMPQEDIRSFLRQKYPSQQALQSRVSLAPKPQTIAPVEQTLVDKAEQTVSDFLFDNGIISDRGQAQRIGGNIATIGEFLPGVGDATAGDEFGRAVKQGDKFGMAMAGLGVIPIVGDVAKKLSRAKLQGFDVDNIFRHDAGYRTPNASDDPILEIQEGTDVSTFDGLFSNQDYLDVDDIRANDFIVKNRATHGDFNDSFYEDLNSSRDAIETEFDDYANLTGDQKDFIDELVTEDTSNLYDSADENTGELPEWITDAFGGDDIGAIEWEIQRIRGQVAKSMGFDAVDMLDETGVSTLLLSTEGAKNLNDVF